MKILFLAAGYGTRVYPFTLNCPKALLRVKGSPLLEYLLAKVPENKVYIVSNEKFFPHFKKWLSGYHSLKKAKIKIISDGTLSEETKLGAVRDIQLVIKREKIDDDLLVIATDELFDGTVKPFIEWAKKIKPAHSVMLYKLRNKKQAQRFGIVKINKAGRIIHFQEKPKTPRSLMACKGIYYLPRPKLKLIDIYLNEHRNHGDAPGHYIAWLCQKDKVYGFVYQGRWFDIGERESYLKAKKEF